MGALLVLTGHVSAGTAEALEACKASIYGDSRLAGYSSVYADTNTIQRRARYTRFEIDIRARSAEGEDVSWSATCAASGSGNVKSLELVRAGVSPEAHVAQSGS